LERNNDRMAAFLLEDLSAIAAVEIDEASTPAALSLPSPPLGGCVSENC